MVSQGTTPRVRRTLVVVAAAATVLSGCSAGSATLGLAGVDDLEIPTASPDPGDFVDRVDNPWLPLPAGATWTYDVSDAAGHHRLRVSVADETRTVDGVATTVVVSRESGKATRDFYAQDLDGNVWWFGRQALPGTSTETSWEAGVGGAEAGVAMLAVPRVGDGYRRGLAPGVVDDVARVDSITGSGTVPAGSYDDLVVTEDRSEVTLASTTDRSWASGVGLVSETGVGANLRSLRLVSADLD